MISKIFNLAWFGKKQYPYPKYLEKLRLLHPKWKVNVWTEDNIKREQLHRKTLEIIDLEGISLNYKSDIFRWDIERLIGGVYADVDFEFFKPFDCFLENNSFCGYAWKDHPQCGLFGTIPNGEWVNKVFDAILKQFENLTIEQMSRPPAISFNMTEEMKDCEKIYDEKVFQGGYDCWPESYSRHRWNGAQDDGWYTKLMKKDNICQIQ